MPAYRLYLSAIIALLLLQLPAVAQLEVAWLNSPDIYTEIDELQIDPKGRILVSADAQLYALSPNDGQFLRGYAAWGTYIEFIGHHGLIMTDIDNTTSALMNMWTNQVYWTYHVSIGIAGHVLKPHATAGFFGANTFTLQDNDTRVVYLNNAGQEVWEALNIEDGNQYISNFIPVLPNHLLTFTTQLTPEPLFTVDKYDTAGSIVSSVVYADQVSSSLSSYVVRAYPEPSGSLLLFGTFGTSSTGEYSTVRMDIDGTILEYMTEFDQMGNARFIAPTEDGGYFKVTNISDIDTTIRINRYDASLELLWTDAYLHPDQENPGHGGNFIAATADNEPVVAAAYGYTPAGNEDPIYSAFVVKFEAVPTDLELRIQPRFEPYAFEAPQLINYGARLSNTTTADISTDIWIIARGPNGYPSQPIHVWEDVTVPALGSIEGVLRQYVPEDVEQGPYNYIVRVGDYPNPAIQDYFSFTVTNGPDASLNPPRDHGVVAAFLPTPEWEARPEKVQSK